MSREKRKEISDGWLGEGVEIKVEGELSDFPFYEKDTYVITTPVNPKRTWNLPMYRRGIERLKPAPKAVGIVTSQEVFDEFFADSPLFVFVGEHPSMDKYMLDRIGIAREKLRIWFLTERTEEYQWWLDSDLEVFEDTASLIMKDIEESKVLMFSNGVERRGMDGVMCSGIGCTMVHRSIADVGRFFVARAINDEGKMAYICEDYMYFTAFKGVERIILNSFATEKQAIRKIRKEGYPTVHYLFERQKPEERKFYDKLQEVLQKENDTKREGV